MQSSSSIRSSDRIAIIAHRGASGYLPEHTLESYTRAIELGADFIEPDLVATKDGVLIARHEPWLGDTTDVAERSEYAGKRTTRTVDGREVTDWFTNNFTLEEIKTLYARQPMRDRDQSHNGSARIPTLEEIIRLVRQEIAERNTDIGLYPEIKHSSYHRTMGVPIEDTLLTMLAAEGWNRATSPVIIQSFEVSNLKYLRSRTNVRLVQLFGSPDAKPYDATLTRRSQTYLTMSSLSGLREVATYAEGIGVPKDYFLDAVVQNPPTRAHITVSAHSLDLFVHVYTFRNEPRYIHETFDGEPAREYEAYFLAGADGVFSDYPDTAFSARRAFHSAA